MNDLGIGWDIWQGVHLVTGTRFGLRREGDGTISLSRVSLVVSRYREWTQGLTLIQAGFSLYTYLSRYPYPTWGLRYAT